MYTALRRSSCFIDTSLFSRSRFFVPSFPRCWEITHMPGSVTAVVQSLALFTCAFLPSCCFLQSEGCFPRPLTPGLSLGLGFLPRHRPVRDFVHVLLALQLLEPCACLVVALSVLLQSLWLSWSSYGVIGVFLADSGTAVCKDRSHCSQLPLVARLGLEYWSFHCQCVVFIYINNWG